MAKRRLNCAKSQYSQNEYKIKMHHRNIDANPKLKHLHTHCISYSLANAFYHSFFEVAVRLLLIFFEEWRKKKIGRSAGSWKRLKNNNVVHTTQKIVSYLATHNSFSVSGLNYNLHKPQHYVWMTADSKFVKSLHNLSSLSWSGARRVKYTYVIKKVC